MPKHTVLPLVAAVAAVAFAAAPATGAGTRTVTVDDFFFSPRAVTVSKGSTVRWVWRGERRHNLKVTSGPVRFRSSSKSTGTYSREMTRTGTYRYVCTLHGGMRGTVRVR